MYSSLLTLPSSDPDDASVLPPRTRRAKNSQYKLGVGRPTAAGGSGARTVTRSTGLSQKGKRGKGSKSIKPMEAAILEEDGMLPTPPDRCSCSFLSSQSLTRCRVTVSPISLRQAPGSCVLVPHAGPSGTTYELPPPEPLAIPDPPESVPMSDPTAQFAPLPMPPPDTSELRTYITNLVSFLIVWHRSRSIDLSF